MSKKDEKYEEQKLNSRSLLESFQRVGENAELEFGEEFEQQQRNGAASAPKGQSTTDALMETYAQALNSYHQGTIDQSEER